MLIDVALSKGMQNLGTTLHLSRAHQRLERSHDTYYPKYDSLYTCRAESYTEQVT